MLSRFFDSVDIRTQLNNVDIQLQNLKLSAINTVTIEHVRRDDLLILRDKVLLLVKNKFRASCMVMVDPPPETTCFEIRDQRPSNVIFADPLVTEETTIFLMRMASGAPTRNIFNVDPVRRIGTDPPGLLDLGARLGQGVFKLNELRKDRVFA